MSIRAGVATTVLLAAMAAGPAAMTRLPAPPPGKPALCDAPLVEEALRGDDTGLPLVLEHVKGVRDPGDLEATAREWRGVGRRLLARFERELAGAPPPAALRLLVKIAAMHLYEGEFPEARRRLAEARALADGTPELAASRPDVAYLQAIAALRSGEVDNCVQRRCRTSCILPIDPAAVHGAPARSREAVAHLTDFLGMRPDDPSGRWLLNVAHMTLGEFPAGVPERWRLPASPRAR